MTVRVRFDCTGVGIVAVFVLGMALAVVAVAGGGAAAPETPGFVLVSLGPDGVLGTQNDLVATAKGEVSFLYTDGATAVAGGDVGIVRREICGKEGVEA